MLWYGQSTLCVTWSYRYLDVAGDGFVPRWDPEAFLSKVLPGFTHAPVLSERCVFMLFYIPSDGLIFGP